MKAKKKIIIAIVAIVLNIAALLAIFIHLDKKQDKAIKNIAAADSTAQHRNAPQPAASPAHGLIGKLVQDIKKKEQAEKTKIEKRKKLLLKNDSLKPPVMAAHQLQHEKMKLKKIRGEKEWDKLNNIIHNAVAKLGGKFERDSRIEVFGWHPYWMGSAYESYNFSLLTTVAYFAYELDPSTGYYTDIHDWVTTALVDSAKANGCNIELTVACFGSANLHKFLTNKAAQATLFSTLDSLLTLRNADGVNIDFEGLAGSDRDAFVQFVQEMQAAFALKNKPYLISIAIPAVDWYNSFDLADLAQSADRFIIMGYDYYGAGSETAGPVSPLRSGDTWWQYNLDRTVKAYTEQVSPSKLLLGLPYYGTQWVTESGEAPSKQKDFIRNLLYRDIKKMFGKMSDINLDSTSVTVYNPASSGEDFIQTWFDNPATYEHKIEWVKENKLRGIGIWALGYDNGTTDLWEVIREECSTSGKSRDSVSIVIKNVPPSFITPADTVSSFNKASSDSIAIKGYALILADGKYYELDDLKVLLLGIAGAFFIVLLLQIILDVTPWKDKYLKRLLIYVISSGLIVALLALLALGWLIHDSNAYVMLFAGLLCGYIIARFAGRVIKRGGEQLP